MGRRLLIAAAFLIVGLVLVPVAGMILASVDPPAGLAPPPPRSIMELLPLIGRTLALALTVSVAALTLGTWLAWVEQRTSLPGARLLSTLSVLPLAVPSYLSASILRETMAPAGWLGAIFGTEGRFVGFWPAALILTVSTAPFVQILVGSALRRLPAGQEEAARGLGASPWRRFAALVAPRLRPTWAFSLAIVALYAISDFGAVAVLDCRVLTWELYKSYNTFDIPNAARLGFGLMILVVPLLVGIRFLHGAARPERGGADREPPRRPLPPWAALLTWALQLFVVGLGVILPLVALSAWLINGLQQPGVTFAPIGKDILDTALLALAGALISTLMALAPAWAAARLLPRRGWIVENGAYLTSSLPGVLVAFGIIQMLVVLKRHAPLDLGDQSLWLGLERVGLAVILGYSMRFLAEGYAALKPAILRLDPRQEESARSLGASPWRRLRLISLPQLAPGFAAAYALIFLAIVKELPITMMLLPSGHTTLAYRVFDAQREGLLPDLGLAGLVLLVLALLMQLALLRWRRHV